MSNKVIVAAGQLGPSCYYQGKVDKKGNVLRILALLEKAIKEKVKVLCFNELALTPYFAARSEWDFDRYFDQLPNDLTKDIFSLTREKPVSVILPYGEYDGVAFYNSAAFIQRGEMLGKYRKIHIPGAFASRELAQEGPSNYERFYFTPGNLKYPIFDLQGVRAGVQICYDRFFPEGFRCLALEGAQVVFNPNALPLRGLAWRVTSWEPILKVRAFENRMFIVGINKGGDEQGLEFAGDSMIVHPMGGEILARAKTIEDELVMAEIDLDDIIEAKKIFPAFRDRRASEYGILVK